MKSVVNDLRGGQHSGVWPNALNHDEGEAPDSKLAYDAWKEKLKEYLELLEVGSLCRSMVNP